MLLPPRPTPAVFPSSSLIVPAPTFPAIQSIELVGRQTTVNPQIAIFITMNPGYAGRSNLPDNLKKLFRSLAMTRPDMQLIAEVTLFSQGYRTAERLANKIVPFFRSVRAGRWRGKG